MALGGHSPKCLNMVGGGGWRNAGKEGTLKIHMPLDLPSSPGRPEPLPLSYIQNKFC